MYDKRWYQEEAVEAAFSDVVDRTYYHPLIVAPTGTGKTAIMCKLIDKLLNHDFSTNVLVLSHDKRILKQNSDGLERYFDGYEVGLYSSGLKSKTIKKITVAGIQSVWRRVSEFKHFNIIIIDECHTINTKREGIYRKFLDEINATYIGLTATHFRTGHGYIHKGKDALFNHISYDMSSPRIYNRIVDEGYLTQLFSKSTALKLETEGLRKVRGDFDEQQMANRFNTKAVVEAAVMELIYYGKKYKHWLLAAINIENADYISEVLNNSGIKAVSIHSKTEDVDTKIEDFKNGKYRAAVQVNMLSTGFDFPKIDLIGDLRPTQSPILHVQFKGRGTRVVYADGYDLSTIQGRLDAIEAGGKPHCLVLDFAGNTARLGPINYVSIKQSEDKDSKGSGDPITKECPDCNFINWGAARECINCGHKFEFKNKLQMTASDAEIVFKPAPDLEKELDLKEWVNVDSVSYSKVKTKSGKESVKVAYNCGFRNIFEWVNVNHSGYARYQALNWIDRRWTTPDLKKPKTTNELYGLVEHLKKPKQIKVKDKGRFLDITDYRF